MTDACSVPQCLAEKENGHSITYMTWVHQSDGYNYFKCEMCGFIRPDISTGKLSKTIEAAKREAKVCPRCGQHVNGAHTCKPSPWLVEELKRTRREVAREIRDHRFPKDRDFIRKCNQIIAVNSDDLIKQAEGEK